MYYVYALSLGILMKFLDQVYDVGIAIEEFWLELVKGSILVLVTILAQGDFSFCIGFLQMTIASWYFKQLDTAFWQVGFAVIGFLTLINISPLENLYPRLIAILGVILTSQFVVYIEDWLNPEEESFNKILNRMLGLCISGSYFVIPELFQIARYHLGDIRFMEKLLLWSVGYFATSVAYQVYTLWNKPVEVDISDIIAPVGQPAIAK